MRVSKLNIWLKHFLNEVNPSTFLNKTGSAIAAGYKCTSDESFRAVGHQNFTKLSDKINFWLDSNGLSDSALKIKLLSLLEAKESKFFAHEGKVITIKEVEALEIQRKTLDMAMKYKKMYPAKKHEITGKDGEPLFVDPETELKKRGIPVPSVGLGDVIINDVVDPEE